MEDDFGMRALYRRVAGVDVHRVLHVVTVLLEQPDDSMQCLMRQFGGFRRDCRELAAQLPIEQMLDLARGKLQQKREELSASLEGDLSARHLFVLGHIEAYIETLQRELAEIDSYMLNALQP